MRRWRLTVIIAVGSLLLFGSGAATAKITKIVEVDCDEDETISAALETKADELIVEFEGTCTEDLVIRRDNVTLRGIAPEATVVGASSEEDQRPSITVDGASGIVLSDFDVRHGDSRGIELRGGAAAGLERLTAEGNSSSGVHIVDGSFANIEDCAFLRNGAFGISVWGNSSVVLGGTIAVNENRSGLILSTGSGLQVSRMGLVLEAAGNRTGISLQLGATAIFGSGNPVEISLNGNSWRGLSVIDSTIANSGRLECLGNPIGLYLVAESLVTLGNVTISGASTGVLSEGDSSLYLGDASIIGNDRGMVLENTALHLNGTTVSDNPTFDVLLSFGTRASFDGGNSVGTIYCDETVLARGDIACPVTAMVPEEDAALKSTSERFLSSLALPPEPN